MSSRSWYVFLILKSLPQCAWLFSLSSKFTITNHAVDRDYGGLQNKSTREMAMSSNEGFFGLCLGPGNVFWYSLMSDQIRSVYKEKNSKSWKSKREEYWAVPPKASSAFCSIAPSLLHSEHHKALANTSSYKRASRSTRIQNLPGHRPSVGENIY